ncbi:esterase/lipase superfamily enzyme [Bradyrhizobium japonicum]
MPQHWLKYLAVWSIAFATSFGSSYAQPIVAERDVLRICEAFSRKAPERMPAIVQPEAAKNFVGRYARFSDRLRGCLSASEREREPNSVTFLIQNTQYESYWKFLTDSNSVQRISIERFRPVTLADDEPWRAPFDVTAAPIRPTIRPGGTKIDPDIQGGAIQKGNQSTAQDSRIDTRIVEFFYATNRKQSDTPPDVEGDPQPAFTSDGPPVYSLNGWTAVSGYTGERNPDLSVGIVRVRVPEGHHVGNIELPPSLKLFGFELRRDTLDPTKHFTIRSIEKTDEAKWIRTLASTKKKKALVFVHGFNTKFRDAVLRAAQITWDLQFRGTTILFSWPSRGDIADYLYDKESALGSRTAFLRVIDDLYKAGYDNIDVIAHSMGNLVAVEALSNSAATRSPTAIAQLIMVAPDVDRDMFVQDISGVAKVAKGLTLYASKNDKALQLSKRIAGGIPRAGDVPDAGPVVLPGLWTIDVSLIGDELFGLNHNTFATTRNVLNDLAILLMEGKPPPRLVEIRGFPEPPQKAAYFRYIP